MIDPALVEKVEVEKGAASATAGPGDEIIGVAPCTDKDLVAVITRKTNALVCRVTEINELAGPGRGVTVIKCADDDQVMGFVCSAKKEAALSIETAKGRTLELSLAKYGVTSRGGRGREMSKKDEVKSVRRELEVITIPEDKKQK